MAVDNRLEIRIVDDGKPTSTGPTPTGLGAPPPVSGMGATLRPTPIQPITQPQSGKPAGPTTGGQAPAGTMWAPGVAPPTGGADPMNPLRETERQAATQGSVVNRLFRSSREAWARSMREMRDRAEEELRNAQEGITHQQRLRKLAVEANGAKRDAQQYEINQTRAALGMSPRMALASSTLATITQAANEISNLLIRRIQRDAEATTARLGGDFIGGEIADIQKRKETIEGGAGVGGGIAGGLIGAGKGAAFGPWGILLGGLLGSGIGSGIGKQLGSLIGIPMEQDVASKEAFRKQQEAFRMRTDQLSQYDPRLAMETAQSRAAKQLRDIGEARIVSEQFGALAGRQRELDTLTQQLNVLENLKKAQDQQNETNDKIKELQEKLNSELKGVRKEVADAVRKLADQRSPIDILLQQGINQPAGMNEPVGGINPFAAFRDAGLAIPLINDYGDI